MTRRTELLLKRLEEIPGISAEVERFLAKAESSGNTSVARHCRHVLNTLALEAEKHRYEISLAGLIL